MRDHGGTPTFAPRLPAELTRVAFRLMVLGRRLKVDIRRDHAAYVLLAGDPLDITHHGDGLTVGSEAATRPIPPAPRREPPTQPAGRAPARRHAPT
jgi:alpha,alpha-trehalose phosphorylase